MAVSDTGLGMTWSSTVSEAPYLHFLMTDFFSERLNDARNNSAGIVSLIPSSSRNVSGKFVIEPVKYGRNMNAFNSVREGGMFPDPGFTKSRIYAYRTRTQFHRFVLDGFLLRAASKDETRYVDPVVDMLADHMDDYLIDTARKLYSDGSGRLCEVMSTGLPGSASSAAQTVTLRINQDIATAFGGGMSAATSAPDQPATMYLEPGMRAAVVSPTGSAIRCYLRIDAILSNTTVTAVNTGPNSATNWDALGITNGDWLVKCSNDDSVAAGQIVNTGYRTEPMGLGGIFGFNGVLDGNGPAMEAGSNTAAGDVSTAYQWSGTDDWSTANQHFFQGLAAHSSASGWSGDLSFNQAIVGHASGTPRLPTESLIQRFLSQIKRTNNGKVNLLLSQDQVRETYAEGLLGDKRYVNTTDLKGGWDPMLAGPTGVPWATDRLCWHNRLYCLSLEDGGWMQHVLEPLSWATAQGAPVWTYLPDHDKYQSRMVEAYNIGVGVRNRCGGVLGDLLES